MVTIRNLNASSAFMSQIAQSHNMSFNPEKSVWEGGDEVIQEEDKQPPSSLFTDSFSLSDVESSRHIDNTSLQDLNCTQQEDTKEDEQAKDVVIEKQVTKEDQQQVIAQQPEKQKEKVIPEIPDIQNTTTSLSPIKPDFKSFDEILNQNPDTSIPQTIETTSLQKLNERFCSLADIGTIYVHPFLLFC